MEPQLGINVLYTDLEGISQAAIVVRIHGQTEGEGKDKRSFTLAQLSVFTEGGGLTSIGAEYDEDGKPGTWRALEVPKIEKAVKAEKLEKPEPEVKPVVFPKLAPEVKPEPEVVPEVKLKADKPK